MKRFLIIILVLFIIILIGLLVFVLTFDANRYNPLLTEKISEAINKDVKIGDISLNIFPFIAIRIDGLYIKDADKEWEDSMLKASSIEANVKILPLIKKDIQIDRVYIRGLDLKLTKTSFAVPKGIGGGKTDVDVGVATAGALKFLARSIDIRDSTISYSNVKVDIIEAMLKNISIYGPVDIKARLSIFGRGEENIRLKALLYPEVETRNPYIKNLGINANLAKFDIQGVKQISGDLAINSEKLYLDLRKIYESNIYLALTDGRTNMIESLQDIKLTAELKKGKLDIQNLAGLLAGGSFTGKGSIKNVFFSQNSVFNITLQDINVAELLPDTPSHKPRFEGIANINVNSSAVGLTAQKLLDTLTADGNVRLDKAVLENMNILKLALNKLSMLPGLVERLENNLPQRYREVLKQEDTVFKPLETDFNIKDRKLLFEDVTIESDAFYLIGSGYLGMDGKIDVHTNLFIPQDLSEAIVNVVDTLKYLQNSEDMITMPLYIGGKIPDISVRPDLEYVIQRLAVSKGQELLQGILGEKFPKKTDAEGKTNHERRTTDDEPEPAEVIIKTIFDILSNSPEPQTE